MNPIEKYIDDLESSWQESPHIEIELEISIMRRILGYTLSEKSQTQIVIASKRDLGIINERKFD